MDGSALLASLVGSRSIRFTCTPARVAKTAISNVGVLLGLLISGKIGK